MTQTVANLYSSQPWQRTDREYSKILNLEGIDHVLVWGRKNRSFLVYMPVNRRGVLYDVEFIKEQWVWKRRRDVRFISKTNNRYKNKNTSEAIVYEKILEIDYDHLNNIAQEILLLEWLERNYYIRKESQRYKKAMEIKEHKKHLFYKALWYEKSDWAS